MTFKVLLADDHAQFLNALRMVLELEPDIEVVGHVSDGAAVLSAVLQAQPDVVCMDINMPGLNGIQATQSLLAHMPHIKVVALSGHDDAHMVAQMDSAGAVAYISKSRAGEEVAHTIRTLLHKPTKKLNATLA